MTLRNRRPGSAAESCSAARAMRVMQRIPLPDSPRKVAVTAVIAVSVAAVLRTFIIGSVGAWVVAGDRFTDPATVSGGIAVFSGPGYDGQFFYRLALNPFALGIGPAEGVEFDNLFRGGRIAYPFMVWMVSLGGHPSLVPLAMIAVNIAAIGLLAWTGARLAVSSGQHAAWGLALPGFVGVAFSFTRNLSEVVAAAAVFTAIELLRRDRVGLASAALAIAVLTREQVVAAVMALVAGELIGHRRMTGLRHAAIRVAPIALVPAAAFVSWQMFAARQIGQWPVFVSTGANTSAPPTELPAVIWRWAREAVGERWGRLAFATLVVLVTVVVTACASGGLRRAWRSYPGEVLLGVVALGLALAFYGRTTDPAYFRQAYELSGAAWLVAWQGDIRHSRRALWLVIPLTGAAAGARLLLV